MLKNNGKSIFLPASILFCSVLLLLAFSHGCGRDRVQNAGEASLAGEKALVDESEVAIRVNEKFMTHQELEARLDEQMGQFEVAMGDAENEESRARLEAMRGYFREQLVEQIVSQFLLEDHVARSDIVVSDAEVEEQWEMLSRQFPDEETMHRVLDEQGMTIEKAREQVREFMKLEKLVTAETGEVEVSEEEALAFYRDNPEEFDEPARIRARHILLAGEEAEAGEKIEALRKRVEAGEEFEVLAGEHSECPSSSQGGDLGFFGRGDMVGPFCDAAFALEAGEMSGPVKTDFGTHLIMVEEKSPAGRIAFEEVSDEIISYLASSREQEKYQLFLEKLREEADIRVNLDNPGDPGGHTCGPDCDH